MSLQFPDFHQSTPFLILTNQHLSWSWQIINFYLFLNQSVLSFFFIFSADQIFSFSLLDFLSWCISHFSFYLPSGCIKISVRFWCMFYVLYNFLTKISPDLNSVYIGEQVKRKVTKTKLNQKKKKYLRSAYK